MWHLDIQEVVRPSCRFIVFEEIWVKYGNKLGLPPTQDSSHHQDYEPFLVGNPELNVHLPLLLGGG